VLHPRAVEIGETVESGMESKKSGEQRLKAGGWSGGITLTSAMDYKQELGEHQAIRRLSPSYPDISLMQNRAGTDRRSQYMPIR
jgi:hypothetical protein